MDYNQNWNNNDQSQFQNGGDDFFSVSGVETVTKKSKGKKAALICGITGAAIIGGGVAAYAFSDFVKNQVKLRVSKPENYYAWVYENNAEDIAKTISDQYRESLKNYEKGSSGTLSFKYTASDSAKDKLLEEVLGSDYKNSSTDETQMFVDIVNNVNDIAIGADYEADGSAVSYNVFAKLNGDNLATAETVIDSENMDFFMRVPELNEKWLGLSLGSYLDDETSSTLTEAYSDILNDPESFLSPDELEEEITRYVQAWNDVVEDVEIEKKEDVDICDITVNYTVATVEIDERMEDEITLAMLYTIRDDDIIKGIVCDKLGVYTEDEYEEELDESIGFYEDCLDEDEYDSDDITYFDTFIDSTGAIRGFCLSNEDDEIFCAFGKDGDNISGQFTVYDEDGEQFAMELYANEKGKKSYDGWLDIRTYSTDYNYNEQTYEYEETREAETYTISFDALTVENEEKGYVSGDVTIEIPDVDPITIELDSDGKSQDISYHIVYEDTDYGYVTLSWSTELGASVSVPDKSSAYMIDVENASDEDFTGYITRDSFTSWLEDIFVKVGISSDLASAGAEEVASEIYDDADYDY